MAIGAAVVLARPRTVTFQNVEVRYDPEVLNGAGGKADNERGWKNGKVAIRIQEASTRP